MELNNSVLSSKPDLKLTKESHNLFRTLKYFIRKEGRGCVYNRDNDAHSCPTRLCGCKVRQARSSPGKSKHGRKRSPKKFLGSSRVTASLRLFEVGTTGNHKYVALLTATGVPVAGPLNPSTSRPAARLRADFKPSLRRCAGPSLCRPSRRPSADTCFSKNCRERTVWTVVARLEHSDYCPLLGQLLE